MQSNTILYNSDQIRLVKNTTIPDGCRYSVKMILDRGLPELLQGPRGVTNEIWYLSTSTNTKRTQLPTGSNIVRNERIAAVRIFRAKVLQHCPRDYVLVPHQLTLLKDQCCSLLRQIRRGPTRRESPAAHASLSHTACQRL